MPEPSRAARIAAQLEQRGMLLPGVTAHHLGCDVYEDTPGLQDGPDVDFDAALEAYVKVCGGRVRPLRSPRADDAPPVRSPHPPQVCHESNVDKSATQAWQRYCKAPFAEALMDLVAVFRTSLVRPAPLYAHHSPPHTHTLGARLHTHISGAARQAAAARAAAA